MSGQSTTPIRRLALSWRLSLDAENKAPTTIDVYMTSVEQLAEFLEAHDLPTAVGEIERKHVEAFIGHLLKTRRPSTAHARYRACRAFFAWAVDDGEIATSPMERMRPPKLEDREIPVLSLEQIHALVKACAGTRFEDRRDEAIIRLFLDTGVRRAELAGLTLDDVDLIRREARVFGKGRRERTVKFGRKTAAALDKYLRERARHPRGDRPEVWVGQRGPVKPDGVRQIIEKRGDLAGIPNLHPHVFRHTFAARWLSASGQEGDLQRLAGWRSPAMLARYGRATAEERAREAHDRLGLGDEY
jgi:site-specific recombinase XerD